MQNLRRFAKIWQDFDLANGGLSWRGERGRDEGRAFRGLAVLGVEEAGHELAPEQREEVQRPDHHQDQQKPLQIHQFERIFSTASSNTRFISEENLPTRFVAARVQSQDMLLQNAE